MDDLIAELQELSAMAPHGFERIALNNPNNKWIVRSSLQKAIRRGQTEVALAAAARMLAVDEQYAWISLAVVMIEDITIGDLDLVAYSTVTTLKSVRDKVEADMLYAAMVQRACQGPKSRACCEIELGVNMKMGSADKYEGGEPPDTPFRKLLNTFSSEEYPMEELLHEMVVAFNDIPDLERTQLANLAMRQRLRNQGPDALKPALTVIRDNLDDFTEQRCAMFSFERTVDTMNLAMFPVLKWLNIRDEELTENMDALPPSEIIMSVGSECFDMHTQQGKKAIRAWWNHLREMEADIFGTMQAGDAYKCLGAILFVIEGGQVDRRITSPGLKMLKEYQDYEFIKGYGASENIMANLPYVLMLCAQQIPKLNELRKWAVK